MNIEDQLESIVERAIRNGLKEYHRDADVPDTLIGVDLDFVNRAGDKINVGWVKMPCVPRIGDSFVYHRPARCDSSAQYRWIEASDVACTVTDVVFSNSNDEKVFVTEVTITEIA